MSAVGFDMVLWIILSICLSLLLSISNAATNKIETTMPTFPIKNHNLTAIVIPPNHYVYAKSVCYEIFQSRKIFIWLKNDATHSEKLR